MGLPSILLATGQATVNEYPSPPMSPYAGAETVSSPASGDTASRLTHSPARKIGGGESSAQIPKLSVSRCLEHSSVPRDAGKRANAGSEVAKGTAPSESGGYTRLSARSIEASVFSKDVQDLLKLLNHYGVRYIFIGGHAVVFCGNPRYTGDVDLFYDCSEPNANLLFQALTEFRRGVIPSIDHAAELTEYGMVFSSGGRRTALICSPRLT
jgi:hypothetical protein